MRVVDGMVKLMSFGRCREVEVEGEMEGKGLGKACLLRKERMVGVKVDLIEMYFME